MIPAITSEKPRYVHFVARHYPYTEDLDFLVKVDDVEGVQARGVEVDVMIKWTGRVRVAKMFGEFLSMLRNAKPLEFAPEREAVPPKPSAWGPLERLKNDTTKDPKRDVLVRERGSKWVGSLRIGLADDDPKWEYAEIPQ